MILVLTGTLTTAASLLATTILIDGFTDNLAVSETAVVLGNTVYPDGSLSPRLKARLDKTIELYRQGFFKRIIVSGASRGEAYDEAKAMKNYLLAFGIEPQVIQTDPNGFNTYATARNTAALLRGRQDKSVLVITQYFHITRCRLALNKFGIRDVRSANAHYFGWRDIYSVFREIVAILVYLLRRGPTETI